MVKLALACLWPLVTSAVLLSPAEPARGEEQSAAAAAPSPGPPTPAPTPAEALHPEDGWHQWAATKQYLQERYGTTLLLNSDTVGRAALAGPQTDLQRLITRYDFQVGQQLAPGSLINMDVRGGWGDGLDPPLGLFANTDQYAQTGTGAFILHLYYEQKLLDDQFTLRLGKLDVGDWIDTNRFAFYNFLGYTLAHDSAIPLTGNTMSAMATWEPKDARWFYVSGAVSNATQTPFETGFSSTFDGSADWLSIAEVGLKPKLFGLDGVYRFIGWHNAREFVSSDGTTDPGASGGAVSFDQDIVADRLGAFFRFGVVDGDPLEPKRSYTAGLLLKEPLPGRKKDSLALGVVVNEFTAERGRGNPHARDTETYVELYYNIELAPWAQLQPLVQVVDNPGGTDRQTVLIAGLHLALRF